MRWSWIDLNVQWCWAVRTRQAPVCDCLSSQYSWIGRSRGTLEPNVRNYIRISPDRSRQARQLSAVPCCCCCRPAPACTSWFAWSSGYCWGCSEGCEWWTPSYRSQGLSCSTGRSTGWTWWPGRVGASPYIWCWRLRSSWPVRPSCSRFSPPCSHRSCGTPSLWSSSGCGGSRRARGRSWLFGTASGKTDLHELILADWFAGVHENRRRNAAQQDADLRIVFVGEAGVHHEQKVEARALGQRRIYFAVIRSACELEAREKARVVLDAEDGVAVQADVLHAERVFFWDYGLHGANFCLNQCIRT